VENTTVTLLWETNQTHLRFSENVIHIARDKANIIHASRWKVVSKIGAAGNRPQKQSLTPEDEQARTHFSLATFTCFGGAVKAKT